MISLPPDDALVLHGADLQALHEAQFALLASPPGTGSSSLRQCSLALSRLLGAPNVATCLRRAGTWRIGASRPDFTTHLSGALALPGGGDAPLALPAFPHTIQIHVRTAAGEGMICAAFPAPSAGFYGAAGELLLGLLLPALQARIAQQAPDAAALLETIEKLEEPLAVYSPGGAALCRSSAFCRRLSGDPEADRVEAEAQHIAARFGPLRPGDSPHPPRSKPSVVRTALRRYELHGSRIPLRVLRQPAALIHLRVTRPLAPSKTRLYERYGLTEREVEVALLVAEGLTSKEIAQRLGVSANTVRRHGEKVLEKLGLHTRAGVAMALLREG